MSVLDNGVQLFSRYLWIEHQPVAPPNPIVNESEVVRPYDAYRIIGGGKASTCGCKCPAENEIE